MSIPQTTHKIGTAPTETVRRENDEQFRELMAHLQQVFWIKNAADDAVLYISPAFETISGRTCKSLYDNFNIFLEAVHPEDRARVGVAMAGQHQTGGYEEQYRILQPDGTIRWVWARSYPICDEQNQIIRFAGIAEDITERKSLELDRARLAAIVEYSEDAMLSMSLDGIVISWNDGAERQYGYTGEEIIGRSISLLFPPDHYNEYLQIMKKVRKGEAIPSYDTVRKRQDGTLIHMSVSIAPIETRDQETVGASKIARDIGKVKQLEEKFRQAQKMDVIGRLTVDVAHDFNNLITIISGYNSLLLDALPPDIPGREYLNEIKSAVARAACLIRKILLFSRKQILDLKMVDLNAVVAGSENMLRQLAGVDVDLATILAPALGRVMADPIQMEQVLMNLVTNARDAMPQGGKLTIETAHTEPTCDRAHTGGKPVGYVMLAVRDTGTGMDETTRARIFEPFFTTKEEGRGTGLGLPMIDGFIKQCGGHIVVCSEPGQGSTFKLYVPEIADAPPSAPLSPELKEAPSGTETILLVDDDAAIRSLARKILQTRGYTVLEAAQGGSAINLAKTHQGIIHLLLSDLVMHGITGRRLAEQITAMKPGIKVLFMSGYANDSMVRNEIPAPPPAFLQKPFMPDELLRKVRSSLDQDQAS